LYFAASYLECLRDLGNDSNKLESMELQGDC
jgi:hypothetical protein